MRKIKVKRGNIDRKDRERALHTDTAPTDVPIVFSNDGFYANLRNEENSEELEGIIDRLVRSNRERYTIPYRYRIRLSATASRLLSLAHPAAQFRACVFYEKYAHLIPFFCRNENISLRRPVKIGSTYFFSNSRSAQKRYKGSAIDVLAQDRLVRNPGSYFVYSEHDRLYKFFNSDDFVGLEKRFSVMRMTDISKCFSSIYSHTMAWAVKDVQHGKENVIAVSFANEFDRLMQFSNYNETNGIPVGAELSRIFAEIILQAADANLLRRLEKGGLRYERDFVVRRYVDDYIIFARDIEIVDAVQRGLVESLGLFNLHLNESKTQTMERPFQTPKSQIIASAAAGLSSFRTRVGVVYEESDAYLPAKIRNANRVSSLLVEDMRVACTNAGVSYDQISPYIIGSIANTIESLIESFQVASKLPSFNREDYLNAFMALLSSMYFFFTVHVTVPASYQVAKATILTIRFFKQHLSETANSVYDIVRSLVADLINSSAMNDNSMSDYVPIEIMNIVLASGELPVDYRVDLRELQKRILGRECVDYFLYISLIYHFGGNDRAFLDSVEKKLRNHFIPTAMPRKSSQDAHFMLDLIACPYLSRRFRLKVLTVLRGSLEMSRITLVVAGDLLGEMEKNSWFVNWKQFDLLSVLCKKELSAVY